MASLQSSSLSSSFDHQRVPSIFGSDLKLGENEHTHLRLSPNFPKSSLALRIQGSRIPTGLTKEFENSREQMKEETFNNGDLFSGFKEHFLSFKRDKYLANMEHFQKLADIQAPKFTVIACADSRVCPSNILGFQPGDAFMVRNVANLVPPFEDGPSETKAALEFSVNTLQVENILVIGHSRCGGIHALMSMPEEDDDSRLQLSKYVYYCQSSYQATTSPPPTLSLPPPTYITWTPLDSHRFMSDMTLIPCLTLLIANGHG